MVEAGSVVAFELQEWRSIYCAGVINRLNPHIEADDRMTRLSEKYYLEKMLLAAVDQTHATLTAQFGDVALGREAEHTYEVAGNYSLQEAATAGAASILVQNALLRIDCYRNHFLQDAEEYDTQYWQTLEDHANLLKQGCLYQADALQGKLLVELQLSDATAARQKEKLTLTHAEILEFIRNQTNRVFNLQSLAEERWVFQQMMHPVARVRQAHTFLGRIANLLTPRGKTN